MADEKVERKIAASLATDVVGYTLPWRKTKARLSNLLGLAAKLSGPVAFGA